MDTSILDAALVQRAEWRGRLMADILRKEHDEETRAELLIAGLSQAYAEGLECAAEVCERVAAGEPTATRVAAVLASGFRDLIRRNKASDRKVDEQSAGAEK